MSDDRWLDFPAAGVRSGGRVYGLLGDMGMATRIAKAAKHCHLEVCNSDRAEAIMQLLNQKIPVLMILDWDQREAQAYELLKQTAGNADFKKVPKIGFASQSKSSIKREAEAAGCDRVYLRAELIRDLHSILMRYAL